MLPTPTWTHHSCQAFHGHTSGVKKGEVIRILSTGSHLTITPTKVRSPHPISNIDSYREASHGLSQFLTRC